MKRKWIIDLPYPEAVDKVIALNTRVESNCYYVLGDAKKSQVDWVGVYYVETEQKEEGR
jgi:hypothetical protein